ncbi:MAG: zinc ribbon domain-containing protein [Myxococcota bacterium]|nr:zinc ribbon domain-containing protein [Myxococcota bacterium]
MPVYEYLCEKCEHEFEREQRITDNPVKTCPNCKARRVKKLISQTSFVLKGGGWYADGYGNANDASSKDADASDSDDASKSTSEKSGDKDSKPSSEDKKSTKTDDSTSKSKKPKKSKKSGKAAA